jgi:hypothetical protein
MILDFSGAWVAVDKFKSLENRDLTIRDVVFKHRLEMRGNGRQALPPARSAQPDSLEARRG